MTKTRDILVRAAVIAAAACMMQAAVAVTALPVVEVYPQAVVRTEKVVLADLAGFEGFDEQAAEALGQVEVCSAPKPGEAESVDVEQVRKVLSGARVNLASLCISGSASCKVYRPGAMSDVQQAKADKGQDKHEANTVETAVRKALADRLVKFDGQAEVRFAAASKGVLGLGGKDVTFHVRSRNGVLLGLVTVDVDIVETGKVARTVPVMAEVLLSKGVVVARGPINRGAMVRPEDVSLEERRFTRIEDIGLTTSSVVVGREAKRFIPQGEMVTSRDIQAMPLVRRGDYVTVWFRRGGLSIRGSAKALKEGSQGERIEVKAEPKGQVYAVVVTGPKTVEADPASSGPLLSRAD